MTSSHVGEMVLKFDTTSKVRSWKWVRGNGPQASTPEKRMHLTRREQFEVRRPYNTGNDPDALIRTSSRARFSDKVEVVSISRRACAPVSIRSLANISQLLGDDDEWTVADIIPQ